MITQMIGFRTSPNKAIQIDGIATRHTRSKSSLLRILLDALLRLDERGQLEEFLLNDIANKEEETVEGSKA